MDVKIATEVEEVSVVVGGHSHSLLYTPKGMQSEAFYYKKYYSNRNEIQVTK